MAGNVKIQIALVSVFHKEGLKELADEFKRNSVKAISTGGTADYLKDLGVDVTEVATLTEYPSILGGRVKTLHPKVFGGILARRGEISDLQALKKYGIPPIDLVVVDLYPFEDTLKAGGTSQEIIEKIDIGGVSLIRAAAKNFSDVAVISHRGQYKEVAKLLKAQKGVLNVEQRKQLSGEAFGITAHYDALIGAWMRGEGAPTGGGGEEAVAELPLRYGENPHQKAVFKGDLNALFEKLGGKELSYNNLVDVDAALQLIDEFGDQPAFAIIKHTNPCGVAVGGSALEAWRRALECDPLSAFGGILVGNGTVDAAMASEMNELFFEVLIAEQFTPEALEILSKKKNRILLRRKTRALPTTMSRTALNGHLLQDRDLTTVAASDMEVKTSRQPTQAEWADIAFGEKVIKHLKSNAIAVVKDGMMIGSGMGQTSRIDAVRQAIAKAAERGFEVSGAVLASDAFFPFADSAEIAQGHGITILVEPGGSVKDEDTIHFCESHGMCLIFTKVRHFRH
jgi:phosphoribosylaminoimidazolecarboxamide formyltransferase/IMP cyclohydrolase